MDSSKWQIKQLDGQSNWPTWKFKVVILLNMHQGAADVVEGKFVKPTALPEDAEQTAKDAYEIQCAKFTAANNSAMMVLSNSMSEEILLKVMRFTSAREMWLELLRLHDGTSEDRAYTLCMQFFGFKPNSGDEIANIMSTLKTLWLNLKEALLCDNPLTELPELFLICKILECLPDAFFSFKSSWMLMNKSDRTINNLTTQLCAYERALKNKDSDRSEQTALIFKQEKGQPGTDSVKKTKQKPKFVCNYCKKPGHIIKICRKWISDGRPPKSSSSSSKENGTVAESALVMVTDHISDKHDQDWYVDNGATSHITFQKDLLMEYEDFSTRHVVKTANGEVVPALGKGCVVAEATIRGAKRCFTLNDVWYVPSVPKNLFSVLSAHDRNGKSQFVSTPTACNFSDTEGNTVVCGRREYKGGLFKLDMKAKVSTMTEVNVICPDEMTLQVFHERMGHQNKRYIQKLVEKEFGLKLKPDNSVCEGCIYGKAHRLPFGNRDKYRAKNTGEILHGDVCGPFQCPSLGGSRYYVMFKDDYSRFRLIFPIKYKSEVAEKLKDAIARVNARDGVTTKLQVFRTDNGKEFDNKEVHDVLRKHGIEYHLTNSHTPEQNGCLERENRTVMETARALMYAHEPLPQPLWAELANTAVYLLNRTGHSAVEGKSPFELWYGRRPALKHLRVIGTTCYAHIPKANRKKVDKKAQKFILIGYNRDDGYRLYDGRNKVVSCRDVYFDKEPIKCVPEHVVSFNPVDQNQQDDPLVKDVQNEICEVPDPEYSEAEEDPENSEADEIPETSEGEKYPEISEPAHESEKEMNGHSLRDRSKIKRKPRYGIDEYVYWTEEKLLEYEEPGNFEEAISCQDSKQWKKAMNNEIDSLNENDTWSLVDLPKGRRAIQNKWVYKLKTHADGSIEKYKARLVVKGFSQKAGIDYDQTFSPVAKSTTIRSLIAMAANEGMHLTQFDVATAFLNGFLKEEIFMNQPKGYEDGTRRVCKLNRSLYGLKQAPRCWNERFKKFLCRNGFKTSTADPCLFIKQSGNFKLVLALYVDDGILASTSKEVAEEFLEELKNEFKVTIKPASYFLGLEIEQMKDGCIQVHQTAYAKRILERFGMSQCNPVGTPIVKDGDIQVHDIKECDKEYPYRAVVGALMYLMTNTRPDLAYTVGVLSRKLDCSTPEDWSKAKRALKYLKGTLDYSLVYRSSKAKSLVCYSDADHGGDLNSGRSTSGVVCLYGGTAISWLSQIQQHVAISTTEAEIVAASEGAREAVWLKRLFEEITDLKEVPMLLVDNQAAVKLAKNPENHKRTKHIRIRDFFVRELVSSGELNVERVPGEDQVADMCTKPLFKPRLQKLMELMGVITI